MKLLPDENISHTLVVSLADLYPALPHVREAGLRSAPDPKLWTYAVSHGYTIVTKDADFHHRSVLHGHPPKIIWIRLGNCSTKDIAGLLRSRGEQVKAFHYDDEASFLVLA